MPIQKILNVPKSQVKSLSGKMSTDLSKIGESVSGYVSYDRYCKKLTLTNSTPITNHQIRFKVGLCATSPSYDVHCDNHAFADFRDLRFVGADEVPLNYYIADIAGTYPNITANVWVNFNVIEAPTDIVTMYYGDPNATAMTNGFNTFPFFDNFNGSSLDMTKWDAFGNVDITVSNGNCRVTQKAANSGIESKLAFGKGYALRHSSRAIALGSGRGRTGCGFGRYSNPTPTPMASLEISSSAARTILGITRNESGGSNGIPEFEDQTYLRAYEVRRYSTKCNFWLNDAQVGSDLTTGIPSGPLKVVFGSNYYAFNVTTELDYVLIRTILDNEPVLGSWSDELPL